MLSSRDSSLGTTVPPWSDAVLANPGLEDSELARSELARSELADSTAGDAFPGGSSPRSQPGPEGVARQDKASTRATHRSHDLEAVFRGSNIDDPRWMFISGS
jgi:hypothetical protein